MLFRLLAILLVVPGLQAANVLTTQTFSPNVWIPDNDPTGYLDRQTIVSEIAGIESLQVTLFLTGGWNGDLFAYLAHESGFGVLLNRIGRTADDPDGSSSSGMWITFADHAPAGDIHTQLLLDPGSNFAVGTYAPDGRTANPFTVTDLDPRTALLSSFSGLPASGTWELFVADLAPSANSLLVSWELEMAGPPVPEPATALLVSFGLGATLIRRTRHLPATASR